MPGRERPAAAVGAGSCQLTTFERLLAPAVPFVGGLSDFGGHGVSLVSDE